MCFGHISKTGCCKELRLGPSDNQFVLLETTIRPDIHRFGMDSVLGLKWKVIKFFYPGNFKYRLQTSKIEIWLENTYEYKIATKSRPKRW